MLVRIVPALVAAFSVVFVWSSVPTAEAAEWTDLLNAADDLDDGDPDTYNPWDFHIEPTFRFDHTTADIKREAPCVRADHGSITPGHQDYNPLADENPRLVRDTERCDDPRIVNEDEMQFEGSQSTLDLTLRAGLYKDLELRATFPYVLNSTRGLRYAPGVNERSSHVDPSNERIREDAERLFSPGQSAGAYSTALDQYQTYRFMDLGTNYSEYEREGFADPSVGIHWAPWNDYRDDTKATMLIGMDYLMPVADQQRHDNNALGRGVHELSWKVAASKRFGIVEPYFGAQYFLPIAATDSLYGQVDSGADGRGRGQVLRDPPQRGMFTVGTEFVPYEDIAQGARYAIDVRFNFGYTSEGRDYTLLFDHMTAPDNECNNRTVESVQPQFNDEGDLTNPDDVACAWVVQQPSNSTPATYDLERVVESDPSREYAFTDLMSVDSYGTFGGHVGLYLQPVQYFQFRAIGGLTHHQPHLLTNARIGRSQDDGAVDMTDEYERNPAYNSAYDNSGDRFRVEGFTTWHLAITTAIQF